MCVQVVSQNNNKIFQKLDFYCLLHIMFKVSFIIPKKTYIFCTRKKKGRSCFLEEAHSSCVASRKSTVKCLTVNYTFTDHI